MQRTSAVTALSFAVLCTFFAIAARADNSGEKSAIEKLNENAQIICMGTPLEVVVTDQESRLVCPWSSGSSFPVRAVVAKVKVLGTTKGKVGPEIEIRYRDYDFAKMKSINVTGILPSLIHLSLGKRYRLYLNPAAGHGWYVGAMKDETQSGFAVQELGPNEKDSDPPLLTDEAIQIATKYLQQKRPSFKLNPKWVIAEFGAPPQHWRVEFFEHEFLSYPAFTYGAEIIVDSDRSIDSDSWIAIDPPPTDLTKLVGKYVRILRKRAACTLFGDTSNRLPRGKSAFECRRPISIFNLAIQASWSMKWKSPFCR